MKQFFHVRGFVCGSCLSKKIPFLVKIYKGNLTGKVIELMNQLTGNVELKFNCDKIKITVRLNSMNTVDIDDIMKAYSEGIVKR